jgi:hypothetical protein
MAPSFKILMSKKGTQIFHTFPSKVPASKAPGLPIRALWKERYPLTGHFYVLLIYL